MSDRTLNQSSIEAANSGRWGSILVSIAFAAHLTACGGDREEDLTTCRLNADCIAGFVCTDGYCSPGRPDAGLDAGSPFRIDSGQRDAGQADGGRPDTPDTGQPDSGPTDAGADSSPADAETDAGLCGPMACAAAGAQCGEIMDGCGASVACGQCSAGEDCEDNRCRLCVPQSCQALGARCGSISDNCGQTRNCTAERGSCGSGRECRSNQCVTSCRPQSCNGRCGMVSDGCGNTLDCGAPTRRWSDWRQFTEARNFAVSGGLDWLNINQAAQVNGSGARIICPSVPSEQHSDRLYLTRAHHSIPADATILGVEVSFSLRRDGTDPRIKRVNLVKGTYPNPTVSANRARSHRLTSSFTNRSFGGGHDTWSLRLSPQEINSSGFGVVFDIEYPPACDAPNTQTVVDYAQVRVYYEEACD